MTTTPNTTNTVEHLRAAIVHLEAALLATGGDSADVPVPETVDVIVAVDPKFAGAQKRFAEAIAQLLASCPAGESRQCVLMVEESAHAAIAAATDAAWRSGRCCRPGAILT